MGAKITTAVVLVAVALVGSTVRAESHPVRLPETYVLNMTGDQETGAGDADGLAIGTISLDEGTGLISWDLWYSGIAAPGAMHIHGPGGSAGNSVGVFIGLGVSTSGGGGTLIDSLTHSPLSEIEDILNDPTDFYLNIHNGEFAGGAVRGQLGAARAVVPFEGTIEGTEDFTFFDPPVDGVDLNILGTGGGNTALLGQFTATWDGDITFAIPESPVVRTFVAENGDEIWSEGLAAGTQPNPNQSVVGNYDIIGGTGLFENATGAFTVERTVFNVEPPFTNLVTTGTFNGTITVVPEPTSFVLAAICLPLLFFRRWRRRGQREV